MLEGVIKTKEKNNEKITQRYKTKLNCNNYGKEKTNEIKITILMHKTSQWKVVYCSISTFETGIQLIHFLTYLKNIVPLRNIRVSEPYGNSQ